MFSKWGGLLRTYWQLNFLNAIGLLLFSLLLHYFSNHTPLVENQAAANGCGGEWVTHGGESYFNSSI